MSTVIVMNCQLSKVHRTIMLSVQGTRKDLHETSSPMRTYMTDVFTQLEMPALATMLVW